ncbi:hypothetical protein [Marinomonas epiphytica]
MQRDDDVEIPSLVLDQDEVSERRPSNAKPTRKLNPAPARPVQANQVAVKKPSLFGVYFLLILILAACAGAVFWLWQQNQQLRDELYGAKSEIQNLDHQLLAADVSANQQGATLEETLKTHDSEIRKLWGVAYDRNRKAIAANAETIKELESRLAATRDSLATVTKRLAVQESAFSDIEEDYNKLVPSVATVESKVGEFSEQLASAQNLVSANTSTLQDQQNQLASQSGRIEAQQLNLESILQDIANFKVQIDALQNQPQGSDPQELAAIQKQLDSHQEAIESSDAFRVQINAEINRLRQQANQLMLQQQLSSEG